MKKKLMLFLSIFLVIGIVIYGNFVSKMNKTQDIEIISIIHIYQ